MSDKSFEEHVRDELAGLRIKPTEKVWDDVSVRLTRKRKRRGLAWLYAVAICLSAGGWWLLEQQEYQSARKGVLSHQENRSTERSEQAVQETPVVAQPRETAAATPSQQAMPLVNASPNRSSASGKQHAILKTNTIDIQQDKELTVQVPATEQVAASNKAIQQQVETVSAVQEKGETLGTRSLTQTLVATDTVSVAQPDSIQYQQEEIAERVSIESQVDTILPTLPTTTTQQKNQQSDWSFHVQANAGVSGIRESFGKMFAFTPYDRAYAGPSGGSAGMQGPPMLQPSLSPAAKDAFAFGIALQAKKRFGKQKEHAIGVSLGYDQFSVATLIGYEIPGTISFANSVPVQNAFNRYYTIQDSADFRSRYHFLRVGLSYHRSLPLLKKHDLSVYVGGGLSWMLFSNGLHVGDIAGGNIGGRFFFHNNSLFHKLQYDMSAGVDLSLDKARRLQVGPRVQYMLSKLSKQDGMVQHLLRPSIQLSYQFNKKK